MSEAKIEVKIGEFSFSGEGDQKWLETQLDKIIAQAATLMKIAGSIPAANNSSTAAVNQNRQAGAGSSSDIGSKALPKFLAETNSAKNQNNKFLATAVWLHEKGQNRLATADVSSSLKNANQTKINNPSEALNQNVAKGYCEKDGKQFFVTEDGRKALGLAV